MPHALRKLVVEEGSLVDVPANPLARVMLFKRADMTKQTAATFDDVASEQELIEIMNEAGRMYSTLCESFSRIVRDEMAADRRSLIEQSLKEFAAAVEAITSSAVVEKVGRKIAAARLARLRAAYEQLGKTIAEAEGSMTKETKDIKQAFDRAKLDPAVKAHIEQIEADNERLMKAAVTPPSDEDVLKAVPESVRKRIEDAEKKAAEAEKIAKAERDQREEAEAIQKARSDLSYVAKAETLGSILKRAKAALAEADFSELNRILKAVNEQLRESKLFAAMGAEGDGGTESAIDRINKKADELVKTGAVKTHAAAVAMVAKQEPQLYRDYVAESHRRA